MSKSPLNIFAPTLGGVAVLCGSAYILADQFVVDLPAPVRGEIALVSAASAQASEGPATESAGGEAAVPQPDEAAAESGGGEAAAPEAEVVQAAASAPEGGFGLGRPALPEEVAAWDIDIRPDGQGLPQGEGDVWTGEELFVDNCAMCHGDFGEGAGRWPQLAMGFGTLDGEDPVKTVGSYWPYLSTVWDYVHRAMPYGNAQSLSDDEVYAITAYILYLNEIVEDDFVLSSDSFAEVEMPNAGAFYMDDRPETELARFSEPACMENCKESVEITMRARVLDVTPDEEEEAAAQGTAPAETQTAEAATGTATDAAPDEAAATSEDDTAEPEEVDVAAVDPALVEQGAKVFRQCQACHMVGEDAKNRVGPHLNDLMGRTVGAVDGFRYSAGFEAARDAGEVWTEEHLAEFLADPRATYQGTRMSFAGLETEADIAAVTAYLRAEGAE